MWEFRLTKARAVGSNERKEDHHKEMILDVAIRFKAIISFEWSFLNVSMLMPSDLSNSNSVDSLWHLGSTLQFCVWAYFLSLNKFT